MTQHSASMTVQRGYTALPDSVVRLLLDNHADATAAFMLDERRTSGYWQASDRFGDTLAALWLGGDDWSTVQLVSRLLLQLRDAAEGSDHPPTLDELLASLRPALPSPPHHLGLDQEQRKALMETLAEQVPQGFYGQV